MATREMDWQGGFYSFFSIKKCWSHLGLKEINEAQFQTWRENYPVTVAVLDTGIMMDHDAFKHHQKASAIQGKNFIHNQNGQDIADPDDDGHGTMCAAIIAGGMYRAVEREMSSRKKSKQKKNEFSFWNGVAPFVNLYICKIDFSDKCIIAAMNHLIKEKKAKRLQVDVISISFGLEIYVAELQKCIQEASLNNIIVVCAASNDGRKGSHSIQYPARFGDVICVGSHDYLCHESSFTSVGREIDILAPGELESACPVPGKPNVKNGIADADGTSFAAPCVSGIVAIILANAQRIGGESLRSAISNNVVMKQVLREMASEPGDHSQFRGHGTLDPLRIFGFSDNYFRQILENITSLSLSPEADENHKLRNYDLRKVAVKFIPEDVRCAHEIKQGASEVQHVNRPLQFLVQDVQFSPTMESINLTFPNLKKELHVYPRPLDMPVERHFKMMKIENMLTIKEFINLEVFCKKLKQEVLKITHLVLPSPFYATYGNKKGLDALHEFLIQLGGSIVSHLEELWFDHEDHHLQQEDIKKIMETLCDLKSKYDNSKQLTVHFDEVWMHNDTSEPWAEFPHIPKVKVIIYHWSGMCSWRQYMHIPVGIEHTDIPNIIIGACAPSCLMFEQHVEIVSQHESKIAVNLTFPARVRPAKEQQELLPDAMKIINTEVTQCGKTVSFLILPCMSDAVLDGKEGVEALKAILDKIGQINNLQQLCCWGTEDDPSEKVPNSDDLDIEGTGTRNLLKWEHVEGILYYLQQKRQAAQIPLIVNFFHISELKGNSKALDIPDISNSNVKVIIHHSAAVCAWRQAQGLQVWRQHVLNGGIVTIKACRPRCNSISKQVASLDDIACDISMEKPTSSSPYDGLASLRAAMQKHQCHLKAGVHVTVAVLGSGVYVDHKVVTRVIKDKACFVPQGSWDLSLDTLGIGTALASIAALFTSGCTQVLVAKVLDEHGRSDPAWVAKAIDWAANHSSHPADVILVPVGFEKFDHRLYETVTKAQKNGKIVIAAAAHNRMVREISYPARHGDVICVGSHSRTSTASGFSVRGREMDFLMIGEERPVKAASAETTISYNSVSGTSVAAAMATAVVSFTLMYAESVGGQSLRDKLKSNTMIRELLREACSSRGRHTPDCGYGTLDPDKLFKFGPEHFKELVKKVAKT